MAAASALKMAIAACVAMLLIHSSVAVEYLPDTGAVGGGSCPSAQDECTETCRTGCDALSEAMCQIVCVVTNSATLDQKCVSNFRTVCRALCQPACQTLST